MSENKGKGVKKGANEEKRELIFRKDKEEYYAEVMREIGYGLCVTFSMDRRRVKRICRIQDDLREVGLASGDIVLVRIRTYEPDKGDVMVKYNASEVKRLKACGQIPRRIPLKETLPEHLMNQVTSIPNRVSQEVMKEGAGCLKEVIAGGNE